MTKEKTQLHPAVEAAIMADDSEEWTSINNVPKAEGGLHADDLARIRSSLASVRGDQALGQPGQKGHGVGTAQVGSPMTDEEIKADDAEYRKRFGDGT
jgi:hypothetical protein